MTPDQQSKLLATLHSEICRMGALIGAPADELLFDERAGGRYWLSVEYVDLAYEDDENGYYVILWYEADGATCSLAEVKPEQTEYLLYELFEGVTFRMAQRRATEEARGQDARRVQFPAQEEMLRTLNPEWGERKARDHSYILRHSPFRDGTAVSR